MTDKETRIFKGFEGVDIVGDVRGKGPLVLFVHGFPELRQSWDDLAQAVADAGYTTCAIDVRGYGDSGKPPEIVDYRMEAIVGDLVAVSEALSPGRPAILVGHDWGAAIVWNAAMARPDVFRAVCALSIPWGGRGKRPYNETFRQRFTDKDRFFYQAYFQEPGRAEAELDADPERFLLAFYHSLSGEAAEGDWPTDKKADATLLEGVRYGSTPPSFLHPGYFEHAVQSFQRTGFRGALNRYRNHVTDFGWAGQFDHVIRQPALFVGGTHDLAFRLGSSEPIALMQANVPNLSWTMLEGCGHWLQAERREDIEKILIDWLGKLPVEEGQR